MLDSEEDKILPFHGEKGRNALAVVRGIQSRGHPEYCEYWKERMIFLPEERRKTAWRSGHLSWLWNVSGYFSDEQDREGGSTSKQEQNKCSQASLTRQMRFTGWGSIRTESWGGGRGAGRAAPWTLLREISQPDLGFRAPPPVVVWYTEVGDKKLHRRAGG